jgi:LmbE family N-acetylglucosaminyl deacetylase
MGTLLCFHAHPDDEAITTGGTMSRAAAEGHRVILVVATGGEFGETPADLSEGETLAQRRAQETSVSAAALGAHAVHFLGYSDSGMTGWDQNQHPEAFMNAPLDEAAERLAAILRAEDVDVITHYDWHGNYGHPDHIKIHQVGKRAAELAGTPHVYEATMNRDHMARLMDAARASGVELPDFGDDETPNTDDGNPFGMAESDLTTAVDVSAFVSNKRAAMRAHASQITDGSFFLEMPEEMFTMSFGTEWFIRQGATPGISESWLAGLAHASG